MSLIQRPPVATLSGISSMATRLLLTELGVAYQQACGRALHMESVGGVDAAKRVQAGEVFDVVVLAAEAIEQLINSGVALAGTRVDLVHSPMALAVRAAPEGQKGAPWPDISSEASLKQAVLAARSLACSSGPSGAHVQRLFARWGVAEQLVGRTVQAAPGVPVATLLARGEAELGFQQLSELLGQPDIRILGPLPGAAHFVTTFAGAVCALSKQPQAASELLAFLASPPTAAAKARHGMQAA